MLITIRKPGQGGDADQQVRDLRAELLQAEAAHFAKTRGSGIDTKNDGDQSSALTAKRSLERQSADDAEEDLEAKRRRILAETREIDADSDGGSDEGSSEDDRSVDGTRFFQKQC
jgi:protein CWC15